MKNKDLDCINKRTNGTCIYMFIVIPMMMLGLVLSSFSIQPIADYVIVTSIFLFLGGTMFHMFTAIKFVKSLVD